MTNPLVPNVENFDFLKPDLSAFGPNTSSTESLFDQFDSPPRQANNKTSRTAGSIFPSNLAFPSLGEESRSPLKLHTRDNSNSSSSQSMSSGSTGVAAMEDEAGRGTKRKITAMSKDKEDEDSGKEEACSRPAKRAKEVSTTSYYFSINGVEFPVTRLSNGAFREVFRIHGLGQNNPLNNVTVLGKTFNIADAIFKIPVKGKSQEQEVRVFSEAQKAQKELSEMHVPYLKSNVISYASKFKNNPTAADNVKFLTISRNEDDSDEQAKCTRGMLIDFSKPIQNFSFERSAIRAVNRTDFEEFADGRSVEALNPNGRAKTILDFFKKYLTIAGKVDSNGELGKEIGDFYSDNIGWFKPADVELFGKTDHICYRNGNNLEVLAVLDSERSDAALMSNLYSYVIHISRGNENVFNWMIEDFSPSEKNAVLADLNSDKKRHKGKFPIHYNRPGEWS